MRLTIIRIIVLSLMAVLLAGCGMNYKVITTTNTTVVQGDNSTIYWGYPGDISVPEDRVSLINKLLKEKGFAYSVKFVAIPDEGKYIDNLHAYMKDQPLDILFSGYDNGTSNDFIKLVKDGTLECLNPYLETSVGNSIKNYYGEKRWLAASYENKNYMFPYDDGGGNFGVFIDFNPKYVTAEQMKSFNGTLSSLLNIYQNSKEGSKEKIVLADKDFMEQLLLTYGNSITVLSSNMFVGEKNKIISYIDNKEVFDTLKKINDQYKNGNIIFSNEKLQVCRIVLL